MKKHADYKKIVENIPYFKESTVEIPSANNYKLIIDDQADSVYNVTRLILKFGNILLNYQFSKNHNKEKEDILAVIFEEKERKVETLVVSRSQVKVKEFVHDENLEFDINDFKGDNDRDIQAQYEWGHGCFPLFKHCGCDCELISCAKSNWLYASPALHLIVLAIFPMGSLYSC
ncbi:hypothetical protein [Paraliobacillus sp. JSM ZJ581]|uniref:hypothetical protein n=1 Tax=Paraliobacillus sp. JSM ZJ581 TaxID=3342118 RepID=UPI0035A9337E